MLSLGDPSGQRTSAYWNEWFHTVCTSNQKTSFEWYASSEEVARVLDCHIKDEPEKVEDDLVVPRTQKRYIHPGSGNCKLEIKFEFIWTFDPLHRIAHSWHPTNELFLLVQIALVPFHLVHAIKSSQHLIIDVSDQALSDVQENITSSSNKEDIISSSCIKCEVANVLEPPLPCASNHFDAWIDKGKYGTMWCTFSILLKPK